ncbi:protein kinase domain-containing protein [Sorangium sp. So ce1335]|uniref:serine/threonine-protein kinase n=1 Tax=Sorangium sp. So ce1335 TaxID=3133335 RepID=UPI003F63BF83
MDGKTLSGRYTLVRLLGRGGMGAVYEAEDTEQKRRVAVKVMNAEILHRRSAMERFEREARAASAIETEHIVRVLDAGVDGETGAPFLVLELLQGEDLAQLLQRLGPLPPRLALRIVAQACVGLQKAHDAGVVHRDIKPANLFLARRDDGPGLLVKVLDFGVAKIRPPHEPHRDTSGLTRSGSMLGTPRYMSPEQARGIKDIDHRTDVWALGIVLYHALAGRTPTEDVEAFGDLIAALVADLPTPVQEFAPWVAPEVAAVVDGALQYQPVARYPSASAMLEAIVPLLRDDPTDDPLSLDKGMLVPLSASEREIVAPRLEVPAGARAPRRSFHAVAAPGRAAERRWGESTVAATAPALETTEAPRSGRAAEAPRSGRAAEAPGRAAERWREPSTDGATAPALETTEAPRASQEAPAPRRWWSRWAHVPVAVLLAAGLGSLAVRWSSAPPSAAMAGTHIVFRARGLSRTPPAPSAAPPPAPEVPVERRVELEIVPADASVEIDGAPARVKDGKVELTGTLGRVREVRVFKGGHAIEERVSITEAGSLPPKLELSLPRKRAPGRKPPPAAPASQAPAAAPAAASPHDPLMPPRFMD